jgi:hypothetical protein
MFPGYREGETTQRIAAEVFDALRDFSFGIQFASFYIPGDFTPHIRMMKTGMQSPEMAKAFGLPYILVREPKPFDTVTLNYNWQIWETQAFSLYAGQSDVIDEQSAEEAVRAVCRFLDNMGLIRCYVGESWQSSVVHEDSIRNAKTNTAGILKRFGRSGQHVREHDVFAQVLDPYDGTILEEIRSPATGTIFYVNTSPLVYENAVIFRVIPRDL